MVQYTLHSGMAWCSGMPSLPQYLCWGASPEETHVILHDCGGSMIHSLPMKPNSSWDIRSSSEKTNVLRYASDTSNRLPSEVYITQCPLTATEAQVNRFLPSAATICHFFTNWAVLLAQIMVTWSNLLFLYSKKNLIFLSSVSLETGELLVWVCNTWFVKLQLMVFGCCLIVNI